jgi:hypothetical protein
VLQVFGIFWVTSAWCLNFPMTLYKILVTKTLIQPRGKRSEDFRSYHGLHQGEVIADAQACRRIQAKERDLEKGNVPIKRYIQKPSRGA